MPETLGEQAAQLKWGRGLKWDEVGARLGVHRDKARAAARRHRDKHGPFDNEAPPGWSRRREQVAQDETKNTRTLTSKHKRIVTLEQLLAFCKVDLEVWRVDRHLVNKWEVGAKNNGGGLSIEPLIQVKAWLVRRKLEPTFPSLQPIVPTVNFDFPPPIRIDADIRSLVWSDPHFGFRREMMGAQLTPFHDRAVLDVILQIAEDVQPDRIDILGDVLDLPDWTDRFTKDPEFYWTTQPAMLEAHWWLSQFRAAVPNAQINIHQGNHELRIDKAIKTHLPAAYDLRAADGYYLEIPPALSIPNLLGLSSLGIRWIDDYPNDWDWLNPAVRFEHGGIARQGPGATAKAIVDRYRATVIFGHTHTQELVTRQQWTSDSHITITGFSPGCTCRIDGAVPGHKKAQSWTQGASLVDACADGDFNILPVRIIGGRGIWNGRRYVARDRIQNITDDLPGWNWNGRGTEGKRLE